MDTKLVKKFLGYEFFASYSGLIDIDGMAPETRSLWLTIKSYHEKDFQEDIPASMLMKLWQVDNSACTMSARANTAILVDTIAHNEDLTENLAATLIKKEAVSRRYRRIAEIGVKLSEGDPSVDFNELRSLIDADTIDVVDNYKEVPCDLEDFLFKSSPEGLYKFRMPGLSAKVPGAGPGNFIIFFARPDVGKTTNCVYEAAGYAMQGLKVVYFANEEPAHRVYLRLVCSYLEMSQNDISLDIPAAQAAFSKIKDNIIMLDCVGMSISEVDSYCAKNKPDVIFLDQLDKFTISGTYSNNHEKLGDIYTYTRETAKRNNCLVWGITQCSAEGEGRAEITYSMIAGSKTGKAAEADLIMGLGHDPNLAGEFSRTIKISKNKLPGGYHGLHTVTILPDIAGFLG